MQEKEENKKRVRPFGNRILIKPEEKEQVLISDDGTLNEYGTVIAVGPDVKTIKEGMKVGFSVFGVEKLVIGDEKNYFIQESPEFLLAIIED